MFLNFPLYIYWAKHQLVTSPALVVRRKKRLNTNIHYLDSKISKQHESFSKHRHCVTVVLVMDAMIL